MVPTVTLRRWLQEPLVHFLLVGAALFALAALWEGGEEHGKTIRLGKEDLLVFMQGRAQVYDKETFASLLETMSAEEFSTLVRDAALQEALYREGKALDLAEADPLVRQRMVQQMRMILTEEAAADMPVGDAEVRDYFERNRSRYATPPNITFTHVFLRDPAARDDARQLLDRLRGEEVTADMAGEFGERFLYQLNYSAADMELVTSHFGPEFAKAVFALSPGTWQGPIRSQHGWHLVLPIAVEEAREPDFNEIASKVREDTLAEKRSQAAELALDRLLSRYDIKLGDELKQ